MIILYSFLGVWFSWKQDGGEFTGIISSRANIDTSEFKFSKTGREKRSDRCNYVVLRRAAKTKSQEEAGQSTVDDSISHV